MIRYKEDTIKVLFEIDWDSPEEAKEVMEKKILPLLSQMAFFAAFLEPDDLNEFINLQFKIYRKVSSVASRRIDPGFGEAINVLYGMIDKLEEDRDET